MVKRRSQQKRWAQEKGELPATASLLIGLRAWLYWGLLACMYFARPKAAMNFVVGIWTCCGGGFFLPIIGLVCGASVWREQALFE
jgi:hypothetical protein